MFEGTTHASFTRSEEFDVDLWATIHNKLLQEIGVKRIEFEEVADDFSLPWEKE